MSRDATSRSLPGIVGLVLGALALAETSRAHTGDDPLLFMWAFDRLEWRDADAAAYAWKSAAWAGYDLNKLWLRTEGEYAAGEFEQLEVQLLYGRAVSAWWDLQLGVRRDFEPARPRNWFTIGVHGIAPWFIELDVALYVGENGRTGLRIDAAYEILFSQRWVLTPELEFDFFGRDDPANGLGSGLAEVEAGLRLRYEIRRGFAPYFGVSRTRLHGDSAGFARADGRPVGDTQLVAGLRAWF